MAASRVGQLAPRTSLYYSDDVEGGKNGGFTEIWFNDTVDPDDAIQEIITAIETTYGFELGTSFAEAPFSNTIIMGRDIRPLHDDEAQHYLVTYRLGPVRQKLVEIPSLGEWVFSFSSSLSAGETNIDYSGAFITVGTITDSADPLPTTGPPYTTVPKTGAQVQKMFPSVRVTARMQTITNPFPFSAGVVGKLNSTSITMGGQAFAAKTVMLTGANITTPNDGDYYTVEYSFEYRADPHEWDAVVVAIDPKTGKPYQGIECTTYSDGTIKPIGPVAVEEGSKGYQMYEAVSFDNLFTLV